MSQELSKHMEAIPPSALLLFSSHTGRKGCTLYLSGSHESRAVERGGVFLLTLCTALLLRLRSRRTPAHALRLTLTFSPIIISPPPPPIPGLTPSQRHLAHRPHRLRLRDALVAQRHATAGLADVGTPEVQCVARALRQMAKFLELEACVDVWKHDGEGPEYIVKAKKASTAANVIVGLNRFIGAMTAWDMRTLYMARVDPYLIAGCEVCLDMNAKSLRLLEKIQCKFLRRMLGVGARCLTAVLFSETGVWQIKYRRVYLALKNLCHIIALKDQDRPVWNALQESLKLARAKRISWMNDLQNDLEVKTVDDAMKAVKRSMEAWINSEIETSARTKDLLTGRLEMDKDNLTNLREIFLGKLYAEIPDIRGQFNDPIGFFRGVLARREVTPLWGKLAFDVLKVNDATPMLLWEP
ncbi:hypothetical protein K438DRAFT_1966596 [Mycena galopus ATCC 62051]|nr:hypothetical protein K438DRAFT_1966596 [Mycena galopus ATCC 62051]